MKKRVADIVVDTLIELGITSAFSVVGGGAMHLNNAFALKKSSLETVYCHHEQACSMAAEGYARYKGRPACVCVTSGPGGINALNGVQGAWVDSIPMIVISGHPRYATTVPATGLNIRCRGVQENDIIRMVTGITKYAKQVLDPQSIRMEIKKAYYMSMKGRRGPVWIDVPLDVQGALVEELELTDYCDEEEIATIDRKTIECVAGTMKKAVRPCILTGSGIRSGAAWEEYKRFSEMVRVPIVGGALRADINTVNDELYYGMSGVIGPRIGNFILQSADVILVLGNSLSSTQTGFNQEAFARNATIIMVDASPDEMKKPGLHVEIPVECELKEFFDAYVRYGVEIHAPDEWIDHCNYLKGSLPSYEMLSSCGKHDDDRVPSLLFWKEFLGKAEEKAVIVLGNSDSCIGVLQEGIISQGQRVLVNYNCGSMGDDIPLAIGAVVASGEPVYCVTGDGSVMLNLQELETIAYHEYPIKMVIMNNAGYGTIKNTCKNYFNGVLAGCNKESGLGFPDFRRVAEAFILPHRLVSSVDELSAGIEWMISLESPCILEVLQRIDDIQGPSVASVMDENGVFTTPPLHIMTPLLSEEELDNYLVQG